MASKAIFCIKQVLDAFEATGGHSEPRDTISGLTDAVVVPPVGGVLHAQVRGDLATMR